jgi:putative N6-adenine-specific DNA methylase
MTLDLFAITAPGLEEITAGELRELGIEGTVQPGGVAWRGGAEELYRANLHLRTASRLLVRVASFRARTFFELERHGGKVDWARFLGPGRPARLRVTSRKSKLYHQRAIAERLARAIESVGGARVATGPAGDGTEAGEDEAEGEPGEQLFVVRFLRDHCTISADASGALLHRRGYRQAVGRAPLRETLAAAMLIGSGWPADRPLLDPFCGSGTILIEAALIARGIPPGLAAADRSPRDFACLHWPDFDAALWERLLAAARARERPAAGAPIQGSDRDAGAIQAAAANAARAGVLGDLDLETRALSAITPPEGVGWLVTNPPYGVRVGENQALRDLYASLGNFARSRLPGWSVALLSADDDLPRQTRLSFQTTLKTRNGGLPVDLLVHRPAGG